jgi:hypothetical protein
MITTVNHQGTPPENRGRSFVSSTQVMSLSEKLDPVLERLYASRDEWVRVTPQRRIRYLTEAMQGVLSVAPAWVEEANRRRKIDPATPLAGEEWISGPTVTLRQLRQYRTSLQAIATGGKPPFVRERPGPEGRTLASVLPAGMIDRLLYPFCKAELWILPETKPSRGQVYRDKVDDRFAAGKVALVLGAGNISSIAPLDVFHKLLVEDQVVVLKMNPVNGWLAPYLQEAFAGLIRDGFLAIVEGDGETGKYLCAHPQVDSIHLTGSRQTFETIVWGADPAEAQRRRAAGDPLIRKPVSAELGCVTPILVVPGDWSRSDLRRQALNVAGMVTHNASFNCNSGKVLLTDRRWPLRTAFLEEVRKALADAPPRYSYYPGANERYQAFLARYPEAQAVGSRFDPDSVPWTVVTDVAADESEYALNEEPFCGVLTEVPLDPPGEQGAGAFLEEAVAFANRCIEGTLSVVVLIDGRTARRHRNELEEAIAGLQYGAIALNAWTGLVFGLGNTHWGAYPGHTREAIGSGAGAVHNTLLYDYPEKSVLRAPFRTVVKPVWFPDHRTLLPLGKALSRFEGSGSLVELAKVIVAALRG